MIRPLRVLALSLALLSSCANSAPGTGALEERPLLGPATLAPVDTLARRHLKLWLDLNRRLVPKGGCEVETPGGVLRFVSTLGDHHVEDLMCGLLAFPEGRRALAWSGLHRVGVAYVTDGTWRCFQDWVASRGLPRPPAVEPSYDVQLADGTLLILIREGWQDDAVTLLREADYATSIRRFYAEDLVLSPAIDEAFHEFLERSPGGPGRPDAQVLRDVFVRLYGNLRSRRTLRLCELEGQRIDSYYRRHGIVADDAEFETGLRESLMLLFENDWRDVYYYGSTLLGVEIPSHLELGTDSEDDLQRWIETHVDIGELRCRVEERVPEALERAMDPVLRRGPANHDHLPRAVVASPATAPVGQ